MFSGLGAAGSETHGIFSDIEGLLSD